MGRFARGLGVLAFAAAASVGCGLISGASALDTDLPPGDDDGGAGGDDAAAPAPPAQITCGAGTKLCGNECVGGSDPAFGCGGASCDSCSVSFAASLKCDAQGRCAPSTCFDGRADCNGDPSDGCEADLTLPQTCGSCGLKCNAGQFCAGAMGCVTSCPVGTSPCGMSCIDLTSSAAHCGSCTNACPSAPHAIAACKASTCAITCDPGYGDCDMNPADGCEALKAYFVDADGDGHGAKGSMSAGQACTIPAGFSAVADDCEDDNANVYFGQLAYFDKPYALNGALDMPSFDYKLQRRRRDRTGQRRQRVPHDVHGRLLEDRPDEHRLRLDRGRAMYVRRHLHDGPRDEDRAQVPLRRGYLPASFFGSAFFAPASAPPSAACWNFAGRSSAQSDWYCAMTKIVGSPSFCT